MRIFLILLMLFSCTSTAPQQAAAAKTCLSFEEFYADLNGPQLYEEDLNMQTSPFYPGGYRNFDAHAQQYLDSINFQFEGSYEVTVYVLFQVDTNGVVSEPYIGRISSGSTQEIEDLAIEIVEASGKWNPAYAIKDNQLVCLDKPLKSTGGAKLVFD